MALVDSIKHLKPCPEPVWWLNEQERKGVKDRQALWDDCPKWEWLVWLMEKAKPSRSWSKERQPLMRIALDCVDSVHPTGRIAKETQVLRDWMAGKATL